MDRKIVIIADKDWIGESDMREIIFKAKRKDNGEWVEGYYCKTTIGNDVRPSDVIFVPFKVSRNEEWGWMKVDFDTICQFTELTDKNGQKIWENDILELPGEDGYFVCEWEEDTARFVMNGDKIIVDFDNYWGYQVEVIGNIFDNEELLEVE